MSGAKYDVVGLGNAIVDVLAPADDAFLAAHGIAKDAMNLIDEPRAETLTRLAVNPVITSGGSGANTIAGLASFGGKGAFIGKVKADELGKLYLHDLTSLGVAFDTPAALAADPRRPLIAVGISLGGNALLRLAGEMGEAVKVMVLTRGWDLPLRGLRLQDLRDSL